MYEQVFVKTDSFFWEMIIALILIPFIFSILYLFFFVYPISFCSFMSSKKMLTFEALKLSVWVGYWQWVLFFAGFPRIVGMETDGLKVTFDFTKPPGCNQTTVITASYHNLSSFPYTDFVFQAAVPKVKSHPHHQIVSISFHNSFSAKCPVIQILCGPLCVLFRFWCRSWLDLLELYDIGYMWTFLICCI